MRVPRTIRRRWVVKGFILCVIIKQKNKDLITILSSQRFNFNQGLLKKCDR